MPNTIVFSFTMKKFLPILLFYYHNSTINHKSPKSFSIKLFFCIDLLIITYCLWHMLFNEVNMLWFIYIFVFGLDLLYRIYLVFRPAINAHKSLKNNGFKSIHDFYVNRGI